MHVEYWERQFEILVSFEIWEEDEARLDFKWIPIFKDVGRKVFTGEGANGKKQDRKIAPLSFPPFYQYQI